MCDTSEKEMKGLWTDHVDLIITAISLHFILKVLGDFRQRSKKFL